MADNLKDLEAMHHSLAEFRKISKANRIVLLDLFAKEHEMIGDRLEDPCAELSKQYNAAGGRMQAGGIIPYIKAVRSLTGLGLKEAKKVVESW